MPITAVLPTIASGMALPATALMLLITTIISFGLTIPIRNRYKRRHFQHGDPGVGEAPIWPDPALELLGVDEETLHEEAVQAEAETDADAEDDELIVEAIN